MAVQPNQLAIIAAIPNGAMTDAFQVTATKTWQTTAAWMANTSGSSRTVTFQVTDSTNTVLATWTETVPADSKLWPYGLGFPIESTQKIRWQASGTGVCGIIGGVKN